MRKLNDQQIKSIQRLYESGYDRDLWLDSLEFFCETFGIHGAVTVPRVAAENAVNLPFSPRLRDMASQFVSDGWYQNDIRADRGWPVVDAGFPVVLEQDIVSQQEHESLAVYHELYRPHDLLWWAGVTFKTIERQYTVSMLRRPDQGPFSEDERNLFDHVRHHLAKALSIAEVMGTGSAVSNVDVLDTLGQAAVLIDGWGNVRACTSAAESCLGGDLMIVDNQLHAHRTEIDISLQAMIRAAILDQPVPSTPLRIARLGRRPLIADVLPVPRANRTSFLFSHALVMLVDLDKRPAPSVERIKMIFGLSPAEARLASILAGGASLGEAADQLNVAKETVRTHLKSIFIKTNTSRQTDLVAVVTQAGACPLQSR